MQERAYYLLLLFSSLASCQSASKWSYETIHTGNDLFDTTRISYLSREGSSHLVLEMIWTRKVLYCYLNAMDCRIPPFKEDLSQSLVYLSIGDLKLQGIAKRHEGGERLTFSDELKETLINALLSNESVTIQVGPYQLYLDPQGFKNRFNPLGYTHHS